MDTEGDYAGKRQKAAFFLSAAILTKRKHKQKQYGGHGGVVRLAGRRGLPADHAYGTTRTVWLINLFVIREL